MPKIEELKGKDIVKFLLKFGFEIKSQKGNHIKLQRVELGVKQILIIPNNKIQKGLASSIFKQTLVFLGKHEEGVNKFLLI